MLLDLITVKFLHTYLTRPMHVMGLAGLFCMALGIVSLGLTVWMKHAYGTFMTGNPLLLLSALLELIGVQFIGMGLIGEMMSRTYFETFIPGTAFEEFEALDEFGMNYHGHTILVRWYEGGVAAYRPAWLAALLAVVVVVMAACLAAFFAAGRIGKLLGVTGSVVMSRLLGVIVAALAVQYVVDGVRAAFGF